MAIPALIGEDVTASAVHSDAVTLEVHTAKAYPPGRPLTITLWPGSAEALALAGRCIGSKRQDDGNYSVRVRLVNLGRDAREILLRSFE